MYDFDVNETFVMLFYVVLVALFSAWMITDWWFVVSRDLATDRLHLDSFGSLMQIQLG